MGKLRLFIDKERKLINNTVLDEVFNSLKKNKLELDALLSLVEIPWDLQFEIVQIMVGFR